MATLYHYWLSQGSRFVRLLLAEREITFDLVLEKPWERRPGFLKLCPSGWPPVLVLGGGVPALSDARAIGEYIEETHGQGTLLGDHPIIRAEVRRLLGWFDTRFAAEVSDLLLYEKVYRNEMGGGPPDPATIRAARRNIRFHMEHLSQMADQRRWLAGDVMSLADLMAAAHLSSVDYLNEAPWEDYPAAKDWYSRVKSRPAFRPILADRVSGFAPPKHYDDLDF
ncbi:MAG: glutathione S-transferase family protein [Minwuia sp.]|uniref:glutathione S-transferase family protein n=1 Tax=Minwuia sp. TaxID=2493630 RepID=UPI003A8A33AB